LIEAWF